MNHEQRTHGNVDPELCGRVIELAPARAKVELATTAAMVADARGLVHGGFTFGLADYAAMLAVNEPTVVLARADVKFLAPVVVGDHLEAEATVEQTETNKRVVKVIVRRDGAHVLEGEFLAVVPARHILDTSAKGHR
jgi:acyl-coenzyme A thioesterase PaaI-like protein